MICHNMLCYAMLCYAVLCYAMLCYAMLCYAMLCYAMLCYAWPPASSPSRLSFFHGRLVGRMLAAVWPNKLQISKHTQTHNNKNTSWLMFGSLASHRITKLPGTIHSLAALLPSCRACPPVRTHQATNRQTADLCQDPQMGMVPWRDGSQTTTTPRSTLRYAPGRLRKVRVPPCLRRPLSFATSDSLRPTRSALCHNAVFSRIASGEPSLHQSCLGIARASPVSRRKGSGNPATRLGSKARPLPSREAAFEF